MKKYTLTDYEKALEAAWQLLRNIARDRDIELLTEHYPLLAELDDYVINGPVGLGLGVILWHVTGE